MTERASGSDPVAAALARDCTARRPAGARTRPRKPLVIGISLSLSGDFSDPGKAAMRGYKLWAQG